jgi:hypothetical protein
MSEKRKREASGANLRQPGWGIVIAAFVLGAAITFALMVNRGGEAVPTVADPGIYLTATAIVGDATRQAAAVSTLEPFAITATYIIEAVTATAQATGGGA